MRESETSRHWGCIIGMVWMFVVHTVLRFNPMLPLFIPGRHYLPLRPGVHAGVKDSQRKEKKWSCVHISVVRRLRFLYSHYIINRQSCCGPGSPPAIP